MRPSRRRCVLRVCAVAALAAAAADGYAQWIRYPTAGAPRTPDGDVDTAAPTPRAPDGKPELSGIWQAASDPKGRAGGIEGIVAPRYLIDITADYAPADVPFLPWSKALYEERNARARIDNPLIKCLPAGVPRLIAYTHPYKIVQTPTLIVMLYESSMIFRQIFMDGRDHPVDPQPSWMGYSVGAWNGDTLVVETIGFNDQSWLDGSGHPHSEQMRVTERWTRRDFGHMDVDVIIDDPGAYAKPLTYVQPQELLPDTDLIEYVCAENAQPIGP